MRPLLAAALLLGPLTEAAPAQWAGRWRPDERVVLADFSWVQAVAAGPTTVFAATTGGLIAYDRRLRQWSASLTPGEGFPQDRVAAAAVDPADESLWLATGSGLLHYQPVLRVLDAIPIPGGATELRFDEADPLSGVFFAGSMGWQMLRRGAITPEPATRLPPPGRRAGSTAVATVLGRFPFAEAQAPTALTDQRRGRYRFIAAALSPDGEEGWLGTDGLGLFRVDGLGARLEPLPFGLLATSAGAVAASGGTVWVGTGAGSARAGITAVGEDIQSFRWHEANRGEFRSVRGLVVAGGRVWAATDRGIYGVASDADGPPSLDAAVANALAVSGDETGLWVGTDRDLLRVTLDGLVRRQGVGGVAVLSLARLGDTLWVGTARGLAMVAPGFDDLPAVPDAAGEPALREPIVALGVRGDTLIAATPERLLWRSGGGPWRVERVMSPELGTLRALAGDAGGAWIGGERGLGFYRFGPRDLTTLRVPEDVPGPVQDLAVAGDYLWIATPGGLVRFSRRAVLP